MRSKNQRPMNADEKAYTEWLHTLPCGCCNGVGGETHHIIQGHHFTQIPLCPDCHRGKKNGWHGQGVMWKVMKKNPMDVLNDTIRRFMQHCRAMGAKV